MPFDTRKPVNERRRHTFAPNKQNNATVNEAEAPRAINRTKTKKKLERLKSGVTRSGQRHRVINEPGLRHPNRPQNLPLWTRGPRRDDELLQMRGTPEATRIANTRTYVAGHRHLKAPLKHQHVLHTNTHTHTKKKKVTRGFETRRQISSGRGRGN